MTEENIAQLDRNQASYDEIRDNMELRYPGRVVLMHDGEVVEIYNDSGDAYKIGCEKFGLGHFSLVTVGEQPINLGFFTMFVGADRAKTAVMPTGPAPVTVGIDQYRP